jgi:hypothetical protein
MDHFQRHDAWYEGIREAETSKLILPIPSDALLTKVALQIVKINELIEGKHTIQIQQQRNPQEEQNMQAIQQATQQQAVQAEEGIVKVGGDAQEEVVDYGDLYKNE